jgi:hypothetical protein
MLTFLSQWHSHALVGSSFAVMAQLTVTQSMSNALWRASLTSMPRGSSFFASAMNDVYVQCSLAILLVE